MPECPSCGIELEYHDYFGKYTGQGMSGIEKKGTIYKCANESCTSFDESFYEYTAEGILREGYPC